MNYKELVMTDLLNFDYQINNTLLYDTTLILRTGHYTYNINKHQLIGLILQLTALLSELAKELCILTTKDINESTSTTI